MNKLYEIKISDARWMAYDIPGNIGWIIYVTCTVLAQRNGISVFSLLSCIPALLMLTGVAELISERIKMHAAPGKTPIRMPYHSRSSNPFICRHLKTHGSNRASARSSRKLQR